MLKPVVSLLALACAACAQMDARPGSAAGGGTASAAPAVSFMEADLDGDARVTPRELNAWLAVGDAKPRRFDAADSNGDGVLTLDEWQAMMRRPEVPLAARGSPRRPGS